MISYSVYRAEISRIIGDFVGCILKRAAFADLPVVQSSLRWPGPGLTIPQSLLARADEVIEELRLRRIRADLQPVN